MSEPMYFALVDDNPDDRLLVVRELRRQFAEPRIAHVTDQSSFDSVVNGSPADLVITDYQLRWTDGLRVLRTIKQRWPDSPVIMFTGTGSEEIAVEAMKAGLDDYVLKSPKHYARLPAAAQVALTMSRQRRELREAEGRFSHLFNSVPVGLYRASPEGRILDANPAMAAMLRFENPSDLHQANLRDLHCNPADFDRWRKATESGETVERFETQLRCRDGSVCWVQNHARAILSHGGATSYEGSLEDITERKEIEDERERLIAELQDALTKVKTLSGLLPICAACKKIRDDQGYWNQIEVFIQTRSDAEFTHSFCPDCMRRLYPEVFDEKLAR